MPSASIHHPRGTGRLQPWMTDVTTFMKTVSYALAAVALCTLVFVVFQSVNLLTAS